MKKRSITGMSSVYQEAMLLAAHGYTPRTIKRKLAKKFPDQNIPGLPDATIVQWVLDNSEEIDEERARLDKLVEDHLGLARKLERVRRLAVMAEEVEPKATSDSKWMKEYRLLLSQIQQELEGTQLTFDIGDRWANLLRQVADAGKRAVLDEGDVGPTKADHRIIKDPPQRTSISDSSKQPDA